MNCKKCGAVLTSDTKFCGKCGESVVSNNENSAINKVSVGRQIGSLLVAFIVFGLLTNILMAVFGFVLSLIFSVFGVYGSETVKNLGTILGFVFALVIAGKVYNQMIGRKRGDLSKPKKWYQLDGVM